ncbi:hypothetical protein P6144_13645 [Sphingomonas sp. HITSZ_GF]|uniref:hypothetical protein n=1 Tax=Sphingomonas sp. HITSZ_GF TaxID=3037247 RepID=UPI00240D07D8|nr:hypothetical protein [Sphingomonas sp. HITSZ_GF]MDG2534700.1 hypothetical protein [Sphingomonas sp. HITSZ_GF]
MEESLQKVGRLMAEAVGGDPEGAFLYAEVESGAFSWGLFIDRGEYVDYIYDNTSIDDAVLSLWEAAASGKEWSGLAYAIVHGSLDAEFYYPDSWDEAEIYSDRRKRILADRYGDKPIKYPPPPLGAIEL